MQFNWIGFAILLIVSKSSDIILDTLLTKFWEWVLSEENLKQWLTSLKLQVLVLYLAWLLKTVPVEDNPENRLD